MTENTYLAADNRDPLATATEKIIENNVINRVHPVGSLEKCAHVEAGPVGLEEVVERLDVSDSGPATELAT